MATSESFSLVPAAQVPMSKLITLVQTQAARLHAVDPRLPTLSSVPWVEAMLSMQHDLHAPLAVLTPGGQVCGYAAPDLWDLSPQSMLHAFLSERNGIVRTFTLPSPTDPDAPRVVAALLAALTIWWQKAQSTGDLIRWPSRDTEWLHPLLEQRGFVLDSVCALRPGHMPHMPSLAPSPEAVAFLVREAHPADEEALLHLFEEELNVHADTVPCARVSLAAIEGFRHKLARRWHDGTLEQGAPLVLVAEVGGRSLGW